MCSSSDRRPYCHCFCRQRGSHLISLLFFFCFFLGIIWNRLLSHVIEQPGGPLQMCQQQGLNVCQFVMNTRDQVVGSLAFNLRLSPGATVYSNPGSSGFNPPSPLTCDSYITSGSTTNVLQEAFAAFNFKNPNLISGSFFVEPSYPTNTRAMFLQLTMLGPNAVVSGKGFDLLGFLFFLYLFLCKSLSLVPRRRCGSQQSLAVPARLRIERFARHPNRPI